MRILMLTSEFAPVRGGIGTYAREIAVAASDLGADVTVAAPDYGKDNADEDHLLPFEIRRFAGGLHSMRDLPAKIRLARRLIGSGRHDVVHAADWPFFIPLALSRRLTTARTLMSVHGTEINETQTALKRLAIRCTGVFGSRSEVAANSHYTADLFRERFAVAEERIHAIPLGVSDFWFSERKDRDATRAAYSIAPDRIVIVTVARITRRKGHPAMLAALSMLPEALLKRITWLVIGPDGETDYVAELKQLAATSGCDVRFLGQMADEAIRDIYGAADLFCLTGVHDPSGRVEGFGLVYLEAGAAGLPSVATAIGGVPDAVIQGRSGLLVPPAVANIARAIATLAERVELRSTLAAGAIAHARALSWRRCAAETYGLPQPAISAAANMPDRVVAAMARHGDVPVFGGSTKRVIAAGHDAGGQIANVLAFIGRDRGDVKLAAQALFAPMLDPSLTRLGDERRLGSDITASECAQCYRAYLPDATQRMHPYAAPLESSRLGGLPPTLIVTAQNDVLHIEAEKYASRLIDSGVRTHVVRYPSVSHAQIGAHEEALAEAVRFFKCCFEADANRDASRDASRDSPRSPRNP